MVRSLWFMFWSFSVGYKRDYCVAGQPDWFSQLQNCWVQFSEERCYICIHLFHYFTGWMTCEMSLKQAMNIYYVVYVRMQILMTSGGRRIYPNMSTWTALPKPTWPWNLITPMVNYNISVFIRLPVTSRPLTASVDC